MAYPFLSAAAVFRSLCMPRDTFLMPAQLTLLVFVSACALSDLMTGRIPNVLILCGLLCAALSRLVLCMGQGACLLRTLGDMAAGFALPYLLLGALVILKMLGAGDVKLLSAAGLQLGWRGSLRLMWYSLLAAAAVCVVITVRRRNLPARLEYLRRYVYRTARSGRVGPYRSAQDGYTDSGEFAFAVPVLAALIAYLACMTGRG